MRWLSRTSAGLRQAARGEPAPSWIAAHPLAVERPESLRVLLRPGLGHRRVDLGLVGHRIELLVRREAAIGELRAILDRAEASGISERSVGEVLQAAREEARQKGLLRDEN